MKVRALATAQPQLYVQINKNSNETAAIARCAAEIIELGKKILKQNRRRSPRRSLD